MKIEEFASAILLLSMMIPAQVAHSQRAIAFEGIENARDMGSLVMQDGRTVRFDMLIRSANLSEATDADVDKLKEQYHLSDVFDFRFDAEAAAAPDRVNEGVTYTHLSTLPKIFIENLYSNGSSTILSEPTRFLRERATAI